jgi:hypothetical protein
MKIKFITIKNGEAVPRNRIPHLAFDDFRNDALTIVGSGGNVVQFFVYPDTGGSLKMLAVLRSGNSLLTAGCDAPEIWPSFTAVHPPFNLF